MSLAAAQLDKVLDYLSDQAMPSQLVHDEARHSQFTAVVKDRLSKVKGEKVRRLVLQAALTLAEGISSFEERVRVSLL